MRQIIIRAFLAMCYFVAGAAGADIVIIGNSSYGNYFNNTLGYLIPFGGSQFKVYEFQQVYAASQFPGPISINQLIFYCGGDYCTPGTLAAGDYQFLLSTTSIKIDHLNNNLALNSGTLGEVVYSGNVPIGPVVGSQQTFTFQLSAPFVYTPASGNLLLTIYVADQALSGGAVIAEYTGPYTSSGYEKDTGGVVVNSWGLETGFEFDRLPSACNELLVVKAAFGSKRGQPAYNSAADVNGDGVVNIVDLSTVARTLPAGLSCQ